MSSPPLVEYVWPPPWVSADAKFKNLSNAAVDNAINGNGNGDRLSDGSSRKLDFRLGSQVETHERASYIDRIGGTETEIYTVRQQI